MVEGLTMDGKPYIVTINKTAIGKVISDANISAEKLAVLDFLDDIIESGIYVGSGKYIPSSGKMKHTIRFDYFETQVTIGGNNYLVTFDVEVYPGKNNYRTHRVIKEMDLVPLSPGEVGTHQPQDLTGTDPSKITIPQDGESVKGELLQVEKTKVSGQIAPEIKQLSHISDEALSELLNDQSFLSFLSRKGGLKLTKGMNQDQKRAAVRETVERLVKKKT